ncbi:H-2 class II histocompatibility antigen, E-S beta chain-like [Aulostomus maculatus]
MTSPFSWSLLFLTIGSTDGFEYYRATSCDFNSTEPQDIEFIQSYNYHGVEYTRFTSRLGRFVGFTEYGVRNAAAWNNDPAILATVKAAKQRYCQNNIPVFYQNALSKSVKPSVLLRSEDPPPGHHPAMLVCSVYDFYPEHIKVSWFRDGQEVTSGVTSTDEWANADWYYQIHSHLVYTPRAGEKISCVVEHASLTEPLYTDWDPSMPESERNKIAIGASGLVLGLILSLAGFIYYKRKARGRTLVPTS